MFTVAGNVIVVHQFYIDVVRHGRHQGKVAVTGGRTQVGVVVGDDASVGIGAFFRCGRADVFHVQSIVLGREDGFDQFPFAGSLGHQGQGVDRYHGDLFGMVHQIDRPVLGKYQILRDHAIVQHGGRGRSVGIGNHSGTEFLEDHVIGQRMAAGSIFMFPGLSPHGSRHDGKQG